MLKLIEKPTARMKDLTGKRFGKLVVRNIKGVDKRSHAHWECVCDCGNIAVVSNKLLRKNGATSCGCDSTIEHHGMTGTREYISWDNMIQRCTNPNVPFYKNYGGRGISVSKEWSDSFEQFYKDMGPRPLDTSIDRIDNDKGYYPDNCRWSSRLEQAANRRRAKNSYQLMQIHKDAGHIKTWDNQVAATRDGKFTASAIWEACHGQRPVYLNCVWLLLK